MYNRKNIGPRIEPLGTPALTEFFVKTYHPEPLKAVYYSKKGKIRANIWPEIP